MGRDPQAIRNQITRELETGFEMARDPDFKIAGTLSRLPKFAGTTTRAREKKDCGNDHERERTERNTNKAKIFFKRSHRAASARSFNSADTFIRLANRSETNSS